MQKDFRCIKSFEQFKAEYPYKLDQNTNYYHQYCKVFMANLVLLNHLKQIEKFKNQILQKLNTLEVSTAHQKKNQEIDGYSISEQRKKRIRRIATQINRHYRCHIQNCQKSYGSQGSLNQHIKLKHPQLYNQLIHQRIDQFQSKYNYK